MSQSLNELSRVVAFVSCPKEFSESTECPVSNDHLTCGKLLALWPASSMLRRLDDRIRELCDRAVKSQDPVELHNIFSQLRAAIKGHAGRLRRLAVNSPNSQRRAGRFQFKPSSGVATGVVGANKTLLAALFGKLSFKMASRSL